MTRKITTLVAVMLMVAATSYGQGLKFGLKGGVNLAKMEFSDAAVTEESNRTGFHIGAYAKIKLPGGIGLQPEAYYSVQGTEFNTGTLSEINTSYLQVPILLVFSPVPVINFHVGPQFGILLDADSDVITDAQDKLKSGDFSIAAGVGLDLPMGLNFTLRYVKALSDSNDALPIAGSTKSSMFQISVGYQIFGLGK